MFDFKKRLARLEAKQSGAGLHERLLHTEAVISPVFKETADMSTAQKREYIRGLKARYSNDKLILWNLAEFYILYAPTDFSIYDADDAEDLKNDAGDATDENRYKYTQKNKTSKKTNKTLNLRSDINEK